MSQPFLNYTFTNYVFPVHSLSLFVQTICILYVLCKTFSIEMYSMYEIFFIDWVHGTHTYALLP